MIKESLGGEGWKLKNAFGKVYDAVVPGSVMSVLLDAGVIEDPYYRENEKNMLDLFKEDYEFFRVFSVSGMHMQEDLLELVFYGVDTLADIYLNDVHLASVSDMHRTYRFSIKDLVRMGANELRIVIHSPLKYIANYKSPEDKEIQYTACGAIKGNQYIRKAHSMFGWDWGPQLPDAGIFRDIELCSYSKARIHDVLIHQEHQRDRVLVTVDPVLQMFDNIPVEIEVDITGQDPVTVLTRIPEGNGALTGYGENTVQILIEDPKLWWPNGLGEHPLYTVKIRVKKADYLYDERVMKIGLRTLTVSRDKDEYGEEFAFCVNGLKIFTMGADYIPEDCVYSRITKERQAMLIDSAVRANYNCLRVWGGGYYPSNDFYDLCDENGIIVWQDLMYACNVYDLTPELEKNIVAETKDNVQRLRHHACLGLWCGNNEIESGWAHWPDFQKEKPALRADYIKMFEYLLPKTVRDYDSETFYWPSSPSSGGCFDAPDDENRGDAHYWDVWHGQKPFTDYKKHYFRFCSEFGFQSFPSMKTIKSFAEPEDYNIFSPVMESHQKNGWANGKILYYLSENFLYPKDFESLLYVSQILQGMAIKCGVEHFRQNRKRCMGTLYWQMNDNWPVVSWSSVDYYGRWKALHYMARRFYAPVAGSLRREEKRITPFVDNGSRSVITCQMEMTLRDMEGKDLSHYKDSVRILGGTTAAFEECDFTKVLQRYGERNVYVEVVFAYSDGSIQVEVEPFAPYKYLALKPAVIETEIEEEEELFRIILMTDVFAPFVFLDLKDADGIFSDNAFHMTPGFNYEVILEKKDISNGTIANASELAEQLTVMCLQDTYMETEKKAPKAVAAEGDFEQADWETAEESESPDNTDSFTKVQDELNQEILNEADHEVHDETDSEILDEIEREIQDEPGQEIRGEIDHEIQDKTSQEIRDEIAPEIQNEINYETTQEVNDEISSKKYDTEYESSDKEAEKEYPGSTDKEREEDAMDSLEFINIMGDIEKTWPKDRKGSE